MGIGVLGTVTLSSRCHPRDSLIGDLVITDIDSVQDTYGMTNLENRPTRLSTSTKSASSNAGVKYDIHVLPSWMMEKAMWHMTAQDVPY